MQQAHIDPNGEIRVGQTWLRRCTSARQNHVPVISLSLDRAGLDDSLDRAMQFDLDRAYPCDAQSVACELPAGMIREAKTVVLAARLVARIARGLPTRHTAKEVGERFVYPSQDILQHMRTNSGIFWPNITLEFWQCVRLIVVGDTIVLCMLFTPCRIVKVGMLFTSIPDIFSSLARRRYTVHSNVPASSSVSQSVHPLDTA